ncbi:hypothetical protein HK102_005371 [Quaeritorhiza haematococci]|nr:hypothetical protein HK102_005371 [Quaeritorhiza haematococci]
MFPTKYPTVLITGASSGIGCALAFEYARRFSKAEKAQNPSSSPASTPTKCRLKLILWARRLEELERIKTELEHKYGDVTVEIAAIDVTDSRSVFAAFDNLTAASGQNDFHGVDVVVVNAGIGEYPIALTGDIPPQDKGNPANLADRFEKGQKPVIETNVLGAMAVIHASVKHFMDRPKGPAGGHIVGIRAIPLAGAYGASKAALNYFLEVTRVEVMNRGIDVTVISPGFIDTPINNKLKSRPFGKFSA